MPGSEDILVNNEKEEEDAEKKMKAGLAKVEEKEIGEAMERRWRGSDRAKIIPPPKLKNSRVFI